MKKFLVTEKTILQTLIQRILAHTYDKVLKLGENHPKNVVQLQKDIENNINGV